MRSLRVRSRAESGELLAVLGVYVVAAVWLLWLASGASVLGVITGEEASVTHRDGLALALRWQPSVWSTNVGSQLFYWVAGALSPDYGLLFARPWKALATALLAPLVLVAARRRLGCRWPASLLAAGVAVALPGVAMQGWVATEDALEAVWGAAALLVATSRRRWWPLALPLAAVSVSNYTAGLAWAAAVLVVAATRIRSLRTATVVVVAAAVGAGLLLAPLVWWRNGGVVVSGGGRAGLEASAIPGRLAEIAHYAVVDGRSYYYFSDLPTLVGPTVAILLLALAVVATVRRPLPALPWVAVAVAAVGLYAVSSGVPGSRRLIAIPVVLALLAAAGADELGNLVRARPLVPVMATVLLAAVLVGPAVAGGAVWRAGVLRGTNPLPIDWPFPVDRGGTQASTLARLDADLRAGRLTVARVGDSYGGTRTLAMLYMLSWRHDRPPPLSGDALLAYYRTTDDCTQLDGDRCAR